MISLLAISRVVRRLWAALASGARGRDGLPRPASWPRASTLVGARARGMGGAFVAVADDASATWWNPAGLPATLIFDGVADVGGAQFQRRSAD